MRLASVSTFLGRIGITRRGAVGLGYQIADRIRLIGRISLAGALLSAVTFVCFCAVTIFPVLLRGTYDLSSKRDWLKLLGVAWPLILAALYLKYKDPIERKLQADRDKRLGWKTRKLTSALAIQKMDFKIPKYQSDLLRIRTEILSCIASSVSEMHDLPRERFCANLLGFRKDDFSDMEVLARSEEHRFVSGAIHKVTQQFGPWRAIEESQLVIEDDVKNDPRWPENQRPPYRSILVLPLVRYNKAYGALTVDCTLPYAFASNSLNLEILVQPYVALLSSTFGPNNFFRVCTYSPPRH